MGPHRRQPTRLRRPWDSPVKNTCGLPFPSPVQSEKWKWSHSVVSDSSTPSTAAHQAPLSMGFSRQECWSGCHCVLRSHFCTWAKTKLESWKKPWISTCQQFLSKESYPFAYCSIPRIDNEFFNQVVPQGKAAANCYSVLQFLISEGKKVL